MNTKYTLLSIASITLMAGVSLQPAAAQSAQPRGARFNFAPNYWRMEQASPPEGYYHPREPIGHAVKSGHVPSSTDILGLDPGSLPVTTPPAPAVTQTQTQAALRQVTPTHYQETFGAPTNAPVMAALPKTATPLSLPKVGDKALSANKAVSAKLMHANKRTNGNLYNTKLAGKLLRKNHAAGQSGQALALKPTSYAKNFGYESGPTVPTTYGDGMNVRTAVSGTLLHRNRN